MNNPIHDPSSVDRYAQTARQWHEHHGELLKRSERRAWWFTFMLAVLLILSTVGWVIVLPLKKTEPYLIRVDNNSGRLDIVPIWTPTDSLPEAVTRHLVEEYVETRERYIPGLATVDYVKVGAMQTPFMNEAWMNSWAKQNPQSPINQFADGSTLTTDINSITFLNNVMPYQVQVRFKVIRHRTRGDDTGSADAYVATLKVEYQGLAQNPAVRALNPLGFKVLEYQKEPELQLKTKG